MILSYRPSDMNEWERKKVIDSGKPNLTNEFGGRPRCRNFQTLLKPWRPRSDFEIFGTENPNPNPNPNQHEPLSLSVPQPNPAADLLLSPSPLGGDLLPHSLAADRPPLPQPRRRHLPLLLSFSPAAHAETLDRRHGDLASMDLPSPACCDVLCCCLGRHGPPSASPRFDLVR